MALSRDGRCDLGQEAVAQAAESAGERTGAPSAKAAVARAARRKLQSSRGLGRLVAIRCQIRGPPAYLLNFELLNQEMRGAITT